jgi:hypothetical protein
MQLPFAVIPYAFTVYTASNERANRPASHLGEFKSKGMVWQSNGNLNLVVDVDLGSAKPINFLAILGANALAGTVWSVVISNNSNFSSPLYSSGGLPFINPSITREDGTYHSHLEPPATYTGRYVRVSLGGHTGDFQAAFLVIGQKLTPASYYSPDFEFGLDDKGSIDWTRYGVAEEESGVIMRKLGLTFSWLSQSDYETKFRPMTEKLGKRGMVYFCFDPEPTVYRQAKTYFGVLTDPPFATGAAPKQTNYEMKMELLSLI